MESIQQEADGSIAIEPIVYVPGSTNGTLVNSEQIDRCPLKPGDVIEIG
jgi:pSer/pThr/pTyr-binding forkhead associated (FHA) protein